AAELTAARKVSTPAGAVTTTSATKTAAGKTTPARAITTGAAKAAAGLITAGEPAPCPQRGAVGPGRCRRRRRGGGSCGRRTGSRQVRLRRRFRLWQGRCAQRRRHHGTGIDRRAAIPVGGD